MFSICLTENQAKVTDEKKYIIPDRKDLSTEEIKGYISDYIDWLEGQETMDLTIYCRENESVATMSTLFNLFIQNHIPFTIHVYAEDGQTLLYLLPIIVPEKDASEEVSFWK